MEKLLAELFNRGKNAAVKNEPRCLYNGGLYEHEDHKYILSVAKGDFKTVVKLSNAWMNGYEDVKPSYYDYCINPYEYKNNNFEADV